MAAVVVNWNNPQITMNLLASLRCQRYEELVPILVDNGSEDQPEFLRRVVADSPEVKVIANATNLGYAAACNAGMTLALDLGADFVFLLNNDITLDPDAIAELVQTLAEHPEAGAAGPIIYNASEPDRIWFAGGRLSLGMRPVVAHVEARDATFLRQGAPRPTEWLTGAAILLSKNCIADVGMMDASYFLYWEDVDWSCRARRLGYDLLVVPRARVWHRINASVSKQPFSALYYSERNLLLCSDRWGTFGIRFWNRAKVLMRLITSGIKRPSNDEQRVRLLAYRDYFFHRVGARQGFFT